MRAIIINKGNLLVMERNKFGKHYFTLVGGDIEMGESKEKALIREVHEETMLHVANPRLVFIEHAPSPYNDQYIYVMDYVSGVPMLHKDSIETYLNKIGLNLHKPMWLPLFKLADTTFRTPELKQRILAGAEHGFPVQVEEFTTTIVD